MGEHAITVEAPDLTVLERFHVSQGIAAIIYASERRVVPDSVLVNYYDNPRLGRWTLTWQEETT